MKNFLTLFSVFVIASLTLAAPLLNKADLLLKFNAKVKFLEESKGNLTTIWGNPPEILDNDSHKMLDIEDYAPSEAVSEFEKLTAELYKDVRDDCEKLGIPQHKVMEYEKEVNEAQLFFAKYFKIMYTLRRKYSAGRHEAAKLDAKLQTILITRDIMKRVVEKLLEDEIKLYKQFINKLDTM